MRRRFPSLTVRRGGSVVTSYVAVDSEQTIGLNQKRGDVTDYISL